MSFINFLLLISLFKLSLVEPLHHYRSPLLYNPSLFNGFIQGHQHIIIAIGTENGDRLFASLDKDGKPIVKLRKPSKTINPHPNEVWLLEPCDCGMNVLNVFRIKHVQSGKYLAASSVIHNTFNHEVTLIDDKEFKNPPLLNDFQSQWMINVQGAFIRNIYYDEYLVKGNTAAGGEDKNKNYRPHIFSGDVLTASKPAKESYWITVLKSSLTLIKPAEPKLEVPFKESVSSTKDIGNKKEKNAKEIYDELSYSF